MSIYDYHRANLIAIAEAIYLERPFSYIGTPMYVARTRELALGRLAIMFLNCT